MKKQLGILIAIGLTASTSNINSVSPIRLTLALTNLSAAMMTSIPKLTMDIPAFPDKIKSQALELKKGAQEIAKLPAGAQKDAKVQALYVKATNLLVEINNILDNFLAMAKLIAPVVAVFDEKAGAKTNEAITLIADTLYYITKIAVGQQRIVKEEKGIKAPPAPAIQLPDL